MIDLIVAGSRTIQDKSTVQKALDESPYEIQDINTILSGNANGVDRIGETIADENNISVDYYPYDDYLDQAPNPNVAPLLRNKRMAEAGDALLAVWDGESSGTEHMIEQAKKQQLEIYVHRPDIKSLTDF